MNKTYTKIIAYNKRIKRWQIIQIDDETNKSWPVARFFTEYDAMRALELHEEGSY